MPPCTRTQQSMIAAMAALTVLASGARTEPAVWIRAGINVGRPVWGLQGGIIVGIWPAAFEGPGDGGPRGLLRIGYPLGNPPAHRLVNFIAVEPDVGDGHWRGLSEVEHSDRDGAPGRLFWAQPPPGIRESEVKEGELYPGHLDRPPDAPGAERLRLCIRMERFANGAHPYLVLTLRSDRPEEVLLQVYPEPDSRPMRMCVLTATMGNYARLRVARLAGGAVARAGELWPRHAGNGFAPFHTVPLTGLLRGERGDVVVPMECDEADPAGNWPYDPAIFWRWPFGKVTQFWRMEAAQVTPEVCFAANGRRVYWASELEVPGGIAFENTELRQPFREGQGFIFGVRR